MIQDTAVTVVLNVCHGRDTDGENHRGPELFGEGGGASLVLRLPGALMMGGKGTVGFKFIKGGMGGRQLEILALQMISMPQLSTFLVSSSGDGTSEGAQEWVREAEGEEAGPREVAEAGGGEEGPEEPQDLWVASDGESEGVSVGGDRDGHNLLAAGLAGRAFDHLEV